MSDWNEYGEARKNWLSAKMFNGDGANLTYRSYKKVEPDDPDYIISGTQNDKIKNAKGVLVLSKDKKEIKNSYYDKAFPNGYQLHIEFDEGTLSCTSLPMLIEMHRVKPVNGDLLHIRRDATDKTKTKYFIKKLESISFPE